MKKCRKMRKPAGKWTIVGKSKQIKENKKMRKMQENEENTSGPRTFHFAWCLNCFGMIASHVSTVSSWMGS